MQGQYFRNHNQRLQGNCDCDGAAPISARMFLCAACRVQVVVCRSCDRGQIYCAGECALLARCLAQRAAAQRYQTSRRGRFTHAARARRYRARCKNVTHQGSLPARSGDLLASNSPASASGATPQAVCVQRSVAHCQWCGQRCSGLVRQGFLRRRGPVRDVMPSRGRSGHGDTG